MAAQKVDYWVAMMVDYSDAWSADLMVAKLVENLADHLVDLKVAMLASETVYLMAAQTVDY
jgi:hypothetical protein